jgi:hypothetical protein
MMSNNTYSMHILQREKENPTTKKPQIGCPFAEDNKAPYAITLGDRVYIMARSQGESSITISATTFNMFASNTM